jgi:hypothetical protein
MTAKPPPPITVLAMRDVNAFWRQQKLVGPAGSLFVIAVDVERFRAEFGKRSEFTILSDAEAWEMTQARDKELRRVKAEQAEAERLRLIEAEAEAERQARHDALIELVRAGVRAEAETP